VPSEEIVIADSSPLIGLARIGQLGLLPQLARQIVLPYAVHAEVTAARADAPGAAAVAALRPSPLRNGNRPPFCCWIG